MFPISKLFWVAAEPDNFFLLALCLGVVMLLRGRGAGLWLVAASTGFFLAALVLPLDDWLMIPLENRFAARDAAAGPVDGVIVLGGGLEPGLSAARGQYVVGDAASRLVYLQLLARAHPGAKLVFTGGSGDLFDQEHREAPFVRSLARDLGLDADRMIFEEASRNTAENALFSKELAKPVAGEHWLLVTSAYHMPRSVGVFRAAGWDVLAFPVGYRTDGRAGLSLLSSFAEKLRSLDVAWHEWVGLAAYRALGKTNELFPGPTTR
ncbi:MAG: YdcF family protein [Desulfovibrionaceae bacterium]|nr:YdcF family protein [Desulfovibrionaceae bacterium]MBF0514600.1 YdcF family protein [Desulfovibrionaceae bacterium]